MVELFIGNDTSAVPERYWEIELTPKGTAWVGYDHNPGGDRHNLTVVNYPCDTVEARIHQRGADYWDAQITMQWALLGEAPSYGEGTGLRTGLQTLKANFFRIQMNADAWRHKLVTRHTPCSPANCTYLCATCPSTPAPDFHRTSVFGTIVLHPAEPTPP